MLNEMLMDELTAKLEAMSTEEALEYGKELVIDAIMVPTEWLPESYQGKRSSRKLRSVVSEAKRRHKNLFKPEREVSVKFDENRNVISNPESERLATIDKYRAAVEAGEEIEYDVNEDKLYRNQLDWVSAAVRAGMFADDEDDFPTVQETYVYEGDL